MTVLTVEDFKTKIYDFETSKEWLYKGARPAIIDFYADWCGPCRMLTPVLEKVAQKLHGKVSIYKLDIDEAQKTAASFQVTSIPTLVLFKDGKEIGRLVGLRDEETIKDFVLNSKS